MLPSDFFRNKNKFTKYIRSKSVAKSSELQSNEPASWLKPSQNKMQSDNRLHPHNIVNLKIKDVRSSLRHSSFDIRNDTLDNNPKQETNQANDAKSNKSSLSKHFLKRMKVQIQKRKQRSQTAKSQQKNLSSFVMRNSKVKNVVSVSYDAHKMKRSINSKNKLLFNLNKVFKGSQQKLQNKSSIGHKQLQSYVQYISTKNKNRTYQISCNFNSLIQCTRSQAIKQINIKQLKLIDSILLCILENLGSVQPLSQDLVRQYCMIYFRNYEKAKLQVVLLNHFFKSFKESIRPTFIWIRIVLYTLWILIQHNSLNDRTNIENIQRSLKTLQEFFSQLVMLAFDIEQKNQLAIVQTFKGLKIIKNIESLYSTVSEGMYQINIQQYKQLVDVQLNLQPFLTENISGYHTHQYLTRTQLILSWKYLKIPPIPFLPSQKQNKYTLVVDLQETLVTFNKQTRLLKYRTFMDRFLVNARKNFQLVLWSDSSKQLTDQIVKQIQTKEQFFEYRLYKDHLCLLDGKMVKDLSRLGRPINKIIIIDNDKANFGKYCDNGIEIASFIGQKKDESLLEIIDIMIKIIQFKPLDVRPFLTKPRQSLMKIPEQIEENSITIT